MHMKYQVGGILNLDSQLWLLVFMKTGPPIKTPCTLDFLSLKRNSEHFLIQKLGIFGPIKDADQSYSKVTDGRIFLNTFVID